MSVPYVHVIYILIDNNEYLRKYTALNRNLEKDVNTDAGIVIFLQCSIPLYQHEPPKKAFHCLNECKRQ